MENFNMGFEKNVFINCPFDQEYYSLLKTTLFTVIYIDLNPLLSETMDSDSIRVEEIKKLIKRSKYSIHDISRLEGELPRFNMPFELGLDIGCKSFSSLKNKKCLILEKERYRYMKVISDISGQDIKNHDDDPPKIVKCIRDWIATNSKRRKISPHTIIWEAYCEFDYEFDKVLKKDKLNPNKIWELPFSEVIKTMKLWIKNYKKSF